MLGLEKKQEVEGHKTVISYVVRNCSFKKKQTQKQELGYRKKPFSSKIILFDYWPIFFKVFVVMIKYAQMTLNTTIYSIFIQGDCEMCGQRLWDPILQYECTSHFIWPKFNCLVALKASILA